MNYQQLALRLSEMRCKPSVIARVLKLNPNGTKEGQLTRGFHRKECLWVADLIGPKAFILKHGTEAYRSTDRRWWKWRGKKKAMSMAVYLDNVWKRPWPGVE